MSNFVRFERPAVSEFSYWIDLFLVWIGLLWHEWPEEVILHGGWDFDETVDNFWKKKLVDPLGGAIFTFRRNGLIF